MCILRERKGSTAHAPKITHTRNVRYVQGTDGATPHTKIAVRTDDVGVRLRASAVCISDVIYTDTHSPTHRDDDDDCVLTRL